MTNSLATEMKQYLSDSKKETKVNKEGAREKVNNEDFTFGPGEFQYVKVNKK